jgi:hypothetical protein
MKDEWHRGEMGTGGWRGGSQGARIEGWFRWRGMRRFCGNI